MFSFKYWHFGVFLIASAVLGDSNREGKWLINTKVNTKFHLSNSKCDSYFSDISSESDFNSNGCRDHLKKNSRLAVLIHGFARDYNEKWIDSMTKQLVKLPNMNVMAISWKVQDCGAPSVFENTYNYACAYNNINIIADQSARVLRHLTRYVGSWKHMHILGHSMGAHIAGQVAQRLKQNYEITVNRITGLDPALPRFRDYRTDLSLRPSHADFVDVIHTNSLYDDDSTLGIYRHLGHVDIYPNDGDNQPGCPRTDDIKTGIASFGFPELPGKPIQTLLTAVIVGEPYPKLASNFANNLNYLICNHLYAPEYMTLSMANKNCRYLAIPMKAKEELSTGKSVKEICKDYRCVEMGMNAEKYRESPGQYYIDVNALNKECLLDNVEELYSNINILIRS